MDLCEELTRRRRDTVSPDRQRNEPDEPKKRKKKRRMEQYGYRTYITLSTKIQSAFSDMDMFRFYLINLAYMS